MTEREQKREPRAPEDTRPIDDPARLAEEAAGAIEKNAAEIRARRVPIASEPPTVYRP